MVTRGNPTSPKVVKTIRRRGARFTCSYEKEKRALEEAVHWLQTGVPQNSSVAVFMDSESLCAALLIKSTCLNPHRFKLKGLRRQITKQWVPGHKKISGNKMADSVTKQSCSKNLQLSCLTYKLICAQTENIYQSKIKERLRFIVRTAPTENSRY